MSCYVVDREHVAFLVQAAMSRAIFRHHGHMTWCHEGNRYQLCASDYNRALEVAQMLWDENIKSVSYRYPDCLDENGVTELPGPIGENYILELADVRKPWNDITAIQVLKACHCFEYQSCEHPGWKSSQAKAFIDRLKKSAIYALPGYDDAEWGAPVSHKN